MLDLVFTGSCQSEGCVYIGGESEKVKEIWTVQPMDCWLGRRPKKKTLKEVNHKRMREAVTDRALEFPRASPSQEPLLALQFQNTKRKKNIGSGTNQRHIRSI